VVCRTATPGSHTGRSTNRVELTCEGCSVRFQVPASQAPRHRFCTRDCSLLWRGAETTCAECGVRFHHGAGTLGKRKHCSRACYLRAKGETGPERVTREVLEALAVTFWQEQQLGRWVVDFLVGTRLVLEVDGAYWHSLRPEVDVRKTGELRAVGFNVVRLPEERVLAPRFAEDLQGLLVSHGALVAQ
jgi:very-short-patch-repair endonuclease